MILSPVLSLILFSINSFNKFKLILYFLGTFIVFNYLGFFTYLLQRNYDRTFSWPLNVHYPLLPYAAEIKERWPLPRALLLPTVPDSRTSDRVRLKMAPAGRHPAHDLVVLIKSSRDHVDRRLAIRRTWASPGAVPPGRKVRVVFLLGKRERERPLGPSTVIDVYRARGHDLTPYVPRYGRTESTYGPATPSSSYDPYYDGDLFDEGLAREQVTFDDLIVGDFVDHYYNNTLKILLGLRWLATGATATPAAAVTDAHTPASRYVLFIDDDYYLDQRLLFRYIDNHTANLTRRGTSTNATTPSPYSTRPCDDKNSETRDDGDDTEASTSPYPSDCRPHTGYTPFFEDNLYAGFVFPNNVPHRVRSSKWFVDLNSYPFDRYPPYVTAGAILLSSGVARKFYELAQFTKPFVFDDVYLSILALKLRIKPIHNSDFILFPTRNPLVDLKGKIASHGFEDPEYLTEVWNSLHSIHLPPKPPESHHGHPNDIIYYNNKYARSTSPSHGKNFFKRRRKKR